MHKSKLLKMVLFLFILSFTILACAETQLDTSNIDPAQQAAFMATIEAGGGGESELDALIREASGMPDTAQQPPAGSSNQPQPIEEPQPVEEPQPQPVNEPQDEPAVEPQEPAPEPPQPVEEIIEEEPEPNVSLRLIETDIKKPVLGGVQGIMITHVAVVPCANLCKDFAQSGTFSIGDQACVGWAENGSFRVGEVNMFITIFNSRTGTELNKITTEAIGGSRCRGVEVTTDRNGSFKANVSSTSGIGEPLTWDVK